MANRDILRPQLNRANQTKYEKGDLKYSVTLFDIDYAIMTYLEDVILPELEDGDGSSIRIPVIYGNSERWNGARKEGIYRDIKGQIQLPIMMLRRSSISKDDTMPLLNRHLSYPTVTKFNKNNRYDRFSILNGTKPSYELYDIAMVNYVDISYECMCWTSYTEHLNHVIEQIEYSTQYWGDRDKFKFRTSIADYNITNEVGENTERVNRLEFTLNVKAYIVPEKIDGENLVKKSFSTKRVVVSTETDITSGNGRLEGLLTTASPYYDNKDLVDFLSLNNSRVQNPTEVNTITFTNIKLVKTPPTLASIVTGNLVINGDSYDIKVHINGVRYTSNVDFNITYIVVSHTFIINFNTGFEVNSGDEITITGKFIDL